MGRLEVSLTDSVCGIWNLIEGFRTFWPYELGFSGWKKLGLELAMDEG